MGHVSFTPKSAKAAAWGMIVLGAVLFVDAAKDRRASVATPILGRTDVPAFRETDPEKFRGLQSFQWLQPTVFVVGGMAVLGLCRRWE